MRVSKNKTTHNKKINHTQVSPTKWPYRRPTNKTANHMAKHDHNSQDTTNSIEGIKSNHIQLAFL